MQDKDTLLGLDGITNAGVVARADIDAFSGLLDSMPMGAYLCDPDGLITCYNQRAVNLWGRAPKLRDPEDRFCGSFRLYQPDGTPIQHSACWMALALVNDSSYWAEEIVIERPNGQRLTALAHANPLRDDEGRVVGAVNVLVDITERKQAEAEIEFLALHDPLTRLPNRQLLLDRLQQAIVACTRSPRKGAMLFLDLDNFKALNDTLGHGVGDELLQQMAARLTATVREGDTVGRFGGDEFVIILEGLSEQAEEAALQAERMGEKILSALREPYRFAGQEHHSTISIGITLLGEHGSHEIVDEVTKRADLAMYQAKLVGRNAVRLFDSAMQAGVNARAELEAEMRGGLQRQEFLPYYQPRVDAEGRLVGAEALARWRHPRRGLISPAEFIPLAEETGLITVLGRVMLETVCAQLATWSREPETARLTLAVNVSARQFRHPDFVDQVLDIISQSGAISERLTLELTESVLLHGVDDAIDKMNALKARGVSFSLDDFGTGYSSLGYLIRLPLSELKMDQHFVRGVLTDPNDGAVVRTMIILAQNLGLGITAEGVETEGVRDYLHRNGCSSYQGYLFAPALPIDKLESFVRNREVPSISHAT